MAEDTNENDKRQKRRLQAAPETLRERSEKLQLKASEPKKPSHVRTFFGGFFWPLRWLGRQIAKLNRFRIFRWIGYIFLPPYVRNSWKELRQVTWPGRRETYRLTKAVIAFSITFGLIVFGVDLVLDKLFKELILK